ncbi:metallophosphoesterase [Arachidicoccus terrestris]|uniref:metallophosphoesterase n=1 Tax=Arachidicoccus terrestris TaxID=2875539 RepID=UPI001CC3466B|nr:metallophosphoesterase [Arachidicoccus terrestris]UAY56090.1 metallophosphoesterase [Arachidicoccus terrestris]
MMKVNHLIYLCILALFASTVNAQLNAPVIRFGLIADPQYANVDPQGSRFYRNSLPKLDTAVAAFNQQKLPFIINLGDITDRNPKDLDTVLFTISKYRGKVYTTTGNHDYTHITDNQSLYKKLQMPAAYYAFNKGNWRFIMLNTNEVASYSNISGTPKEKELQQMLQQIKENNGKNGYPYNGGISKKQLQWLEQQLRNAERKKENVLVFSHHPLGCAVGLTALNDQEITSVIRQYSCVKALISGHHHAGAFCHIGSIPCIVVEGMVETADQNSYGTVTLYPDRIVLDGQGRMTSRTIKLTD